MSQIVPIASLSTKIPKQSRATFWTFVITILQFMVLITLESVKNVVMDYKYDPRISCLFNELHRIFMFL